MKGNFKKTKTLFTQIIIVFLLFAVATYSLWRINLIKFPEFIENLLSPTASDKGEYYGDGYEIFEYLSLATTEEKDRIYPEISFDNLHDILSSVEPYSNFYWETTAEVISSTGKFSKICRSRISGSRYNIEILGTNEKTVKKCVSDGIRAYITQYNGNAKTSYAYTKGIVDFYSDAGIISIENFKDFQFTDSNCEIRSVNKNDINLISIEYIYERNDVNVKNNYLLSLDFGVVLYAECAENDNVVYRLTTNSIYPLDSLDDELFSVD